MTTKKISIETESGPPPFTPDPEIMKKDPMAEIFGPGSGLKLVGDPDDQIPDEVRIAIEEHGLSDRAFQCMLKQIPEGSSLLDHSCSSNSSYIKGWIRHVPSIQYIAKNYGPGDYVLHFTWREKNQETDNKSVARAQSIPISISDKAMGEYKSHRMNQKLEEASNLSTKVQEKLIEKKLEDQMLETLGGGKKEGEPIDAAAAAKNYIAQTIETARMIGLSPIAGSLPSKAGIEWEKLMPALVSGAGIILTALNQAAQARREESNKMMMLMMNMSQSSNTQIVEILKSQNGAGTGQAMFKEIKDMIFSAVDLKEALNPPKEGIADKIFNLVQGIAPQIFAIAQNASEARKLAGSTIQGKMAKAYIENDPDFKALQKNPEELQSFVNRIDTAYGWQQADTILAVAGWERPEACPRMGEGVPPALEKVVQ